MKRKSRLICRCVGLCCCLAMTAAMTSINSAYVDAKSGDVDGDGVISIKDVLALDAYLNGFTSSVGDSADANCDGKLDESDIVQIMKVVKGEKDNKQYYLKGGDGNTYVTYSNYDVGKNTASSRYMCGYALYNEAGKLAYSEVTPLQQKILWNAKKIADKIRAEEFSYGDAPYNPAMNCDAKKVSCDRFVGWVLYECGYTDQPQTQGLVVSNPLSSWNSLVSWCISHNFKKIESIDALEPGDIIFTKPNGTTYPFHTFIYAGKQSNGSYYRYDAGSVYRIRCTSSYSNYATKNPYLTFTSGQPFVEGISEFMYAYRPV